MVMCHVDEAVGKENTFLSLFFPNCISQISPVKSNKVRRSNSWRSLKDRENRPMNSRTYSVDQLNRKQRYDRLSSTLVNYSHSKNRKQMFSTLSHQSTGADSGYSERSSFSIYRKTSTDSLTLNEKAMISARKHPQRADRRRRNLSCDSSLWMRPQFTSIDTPNSSIFGELNLAAIELDSLQTSPIAKDQQSYLVWNDYRTFQHSPNANGTRTFAVRRGDQVRLVRRIGKSTLLVQKQDDGTIGFLPQSCLAHHQINSFLTLKGLRETVL